MQAAQSLPKTLGSALLLLVAHGALGGSTNDAWGNKGREAFGRSAKIRRKILDKTSDPAKEFERTATVEALIALLESR